MSNDSAVQEQWISVKTAKGESFEAFAVAPVGSERRGPGILLIQEIFGVNAHIRGVARQYALDGYSVLAPDVFWRQKPRVELGYDQEGFTKGVELMQKQDFALTVQDLGAALATLRKQPSCTGKVAAIGYCMGGLLSYLLAASSDLDAAVAYYGGGIQGKLSEASKVKSPILFHYGEKDSHIPLDAVEGVRKAFEGRSNAKLHIYPAADHGFNCWARGSYHQNSAALARGRTLEFLAEALKG